jgi:hypothetical protein
MALRSPTPFHNFWGITSPTSNADWLVGQLPNENLGNPNYYGNDNVQIGDFAYVSGASTFYVCTVAGTSAGGGATWAQITTGSATTDRFAPKYLIGGSTDSATELVNVDGFNYIPYAGYGIYVGWQAALAAVWSGAPGDAHFRPGTFALDGPLEVPLGCSLRGAGRTTIFTTVAAGDDKLGAFVLRAGSTLSDCAIAADAPAVAAGDATTLGVVYVFAGASPVPGTAHVENVYATYSIDPLSTVTACRSIYRVGALMGAKFSDCDNLLTGTLGGGSSSLCGWYAAATSESLVISSSSQSTGLGTDAAVICDGAALSISQLTANDTDSVGVGVYSESVVNIVNSTVNANGGVALQIGNTSCAVGVSNCVLTTGDNLAFALVSTGRGRIVGNGISAISNNAIDTTGCTGHAIGFNTIDGIVTTTVNDEVAHNI